MKYFTAAWYQGDLPEAECAAVRDAYRARLEAIKPRLPPEVRRLASDVSLHDGLVRRVVLDEGARALTVLLRCGDLQVGYFDLTLSYSGSSRY